MRIAIMQPYFLPYISYWQLIHAVDVFIIFDDVNFIKKGFINRNTILVNNKPYRFSLELNYSSQNKKINEIDIINNSKKLIKTVELNYKKSPNFEIIFPILLNIFNQPERNLAKFIGYSLKKISQHLNIKTKFIYSSDIKKSKNLKGQEKIIEICQKSDARSYVNAIGGKKLYDAKIFKKKKIDLYFLETNKVKYNQFEKKFIPNLSILDILMFNEKKNIQSMLKNYQLIKAG